MDKHSSLFCPTVIDKENMFLTLTIVQNESHLATPSILAQILYIQI